MAKKKKSISQDTENIIVESSNSENETHLNSAENLTSHLTETGESNNQTFSEQSIFLTEEPNELQELFLSDDLVEFSDEEATEVGEDVVLDVNEEQSLTDSISDILEEKVSLEASENEEAVNSEVLTEALEGSELEEFDAANIEELEFVEDERLESIIESILFATDKPVSLNAIKLVFKGTNVKTEKIRRVLDKLAVDYASGNRGIVLEEVPGGYQLRTKIDNMNFLKRTLKARPFKLSGPALEVLAIVAYKQPLIKHEIDEIRGVESGHLLRALMEKNIVTFAGKSELPGKPMQYVTTKKFLEIFGLRNLKELPTLSQIDELLPEGINEEDEIKNAKLSSITDTLSENIQIGSYSQGEDELIKLTEQLDEITTSSDFFEQEKQRQKEKKEFEKAQNIRESLVLGENVATRDVNWLKRYDDAIAAGFKTLEESNAASKLAMLKNSEETQPSQETNSEAGDSLVENNEETGDANSDSISDLNNEAIFVDQSDENELNFDEAEDELPSIASDEEFEGTP